MRSRFQKVLITGGSSGIGQALTAAFIKEGASVVVISRRAEGVPAGAVHWQQDLADENGSAWENLEKKIAREDFDLVINAAGGGECISFDEITPEMARKAWGLMVEAPRRICAVALPGLLKNKGALVNVSSMAADFPLPYMALYNSSKAALSALTQSMIDEYPSLQIIDLKPGDIRTGFAKNAPMTEEKVWSATSKHLKKMIDGAPGPEVVVKGLMRALRKRKSGVLRLGEFFQTVIMPLGARLGPSKIVHAVRRAYLKR
jgi:short-subunit dehydrogenase